MYKSVFYVATVMVMIGCDGTSLSSLNTKSPQENDTSKTQVSHPHDTTMIETRIKKIYLDAINQKRSQNQNCGTSGTKPAVGPLVWNDTLYKSAYEHSEDLAESGTFSHDGSGTVSDWTAQVQKLGKGSSVKERIENNGYTNWKNIGENITAGTGRDTAEKAMTAWMKSDGHCANIMNANYTEVGMAYFEKIDTKYKHYWTQNFGSKLTY